MIGSHLPNRTVGAKVPNFGRGEGKMVGLFTISFCSVHNDVLFFLPVHIQPEQLNSVQTRTMIQNSVLDAGFDVRDLSHKSYRSVSTPASFSDFSGPRDTWT